MEMDTHAEPRTQSTFSNGEPLNASLMFDLLLGDMQLV